MIVEDEIVEDEIMVVHEDFDRIEDIFLDYPDSGFEDEGGPHDLINLLHQLEDVPLEEVFFPDSEDSSSDDDDRTSCYKCSPEKEGDDMVRKQFRVLKSEGRLYDVPENFDNSGKDSSPLKEEIDRYTQKVKKSNFYRKKQQKLLVAFPFMYRGLVPPTQPLGKARRRLDVLE